MFRTTISLIALSLFVCSPALADDHAKKNANFAEYSVHGGFSPFGGSVNFGYNSSEKTTWQFGFGGAPNLLELDVDVDGNTYKAKSSSAWTGMFVNHRPFEKAMWFRFVAGIGIGKIKNELDDGNGNRARADYTENPVGYLGCGFGNKAEKGFLIGFDIGVLYTGGPNVRAVEGSPDLEGIEDYWMFGSVLPNAQLTLGYGF